MPDKKPPVAALDPSCVWSPSADEAAVKLFQTLPKGSHEQAAAIYQQTGPQGLLEYCYSLPVAGDEYNFAMRTEAGRQLAAIAHTHPADERSNQFSPNDVATADALKRPSYIHDQGSGDIRRYDPGVSKVGRNRTAPGQIVPSRREQLVAAYDQQAQLEAK